MAKAPDYAAGEYAYKPREKFLFVAEFKLAKSVTAVIFDRMEPARKVHSPRPVKKLQRPNCARDAPR